MTRPYYHRWDGFFVYENPDGTFHILVVDDGGGDVFADHILDRESAEWAAAALNAALTAKQRGAP